jgi:hypothetical protein
MMSYESFSILLILINPKRIEKLPGNRLERIHIQQYNSEQEKEETSTLENTEN